MAQLAKHLSCKCVDLSADPQNPHRSQERWSTSVIPALGRGKQDRQLAKLTSSRFTERICLKKIRWRGLKTTLNVNLCPLHTSAVCIFQMSVATWGPLRLHMNLRTIFSISVKYVSGVFARAAWELQTPQAAQTTSFLSFLAPSPLEGVIHVSVVKLSQWWHTPLIPTQEAETVKSLISLSYTNKLYLKKIIYIWSFYIYNIYINTISMGFIQFIRMTYRQWSS